MYRLCVFDLDGTLADTLDSLHKSINLTLEKEGYPPITRDQCASFVGNGARLLVTESLAACHERAPEAVARCFRTFRDYFDTYCGYHVQPYPGVPALLQQLKEEGVRLGVFTNKLHAQAVRVVTDVFGGGLFDYVQGQTEAIPRKPDPTGLFSMMEKAGVTDRETIYVGDSEVDVEVAGRAGVQLAAVDWGFRTRERLADAGAKRIVSSTDALLRLITDADR